MAFESAVDPDIVLNYDSLEDGRNVRTSRKSITPSGWFGEDKSMIQEIENFLTDEECDYLENFARNNKIWDVTESHYNENGTIIYDHRPWENRVATLNTLMKADEKVVEMLRAIIERLKPVIDEFFQVNAEPTNPAIVRWPVGTFQFPHADKELHEGPDAGTENDFPWYDLGTIFYLNDDYTGGELHFPRQEVMFKPKRKAVYFFPGDKYFIHGVNKVLSGTRYTSPWFWTIRELHGERKNVSW
jgi:hypothetical protein